jgi:hypothetical protein
LVLLTPLLPFAPSFDKSSSEIAREGDGVALEADRESDDVLRLLGFVLPLSSIVSITV